MLASSSPPALRLWSPLGLRRGLDPLFLPIVGLLLLSSPLLIREFKLGLRILQRSFAF